MQPMQQQPPKKKPSKLAIGCGSLVALVVFIVIISAATSSGGKSNTGTASTSGSSTTSSINTQPAQHFKVGDTVKVGDTWQVVVNSVKTDDGGQFSGLKSGDTYLVVDVSLTNLSSSEQNVSSILFFTLQDSTGQKYNETVDPNASATLDGKVSAGSPLRGSLVYEVPASTKSFVLNFAPDIVGSGQTVWDLSV
jgi:hypothetical protein